MRKDLGIFFCSNNIERFRMNLSPKIAKYFNCEICDYQCSKQSDWKKHTLTHKHINRTNLNYLEQKNSTNSQKIFVCECGKEYSARNSLWYHKKKCSIVQEEEILNTNTTQPTYNNTDVDKELLIKMFLKNQDVMEGILLKNQDFMEKMMEIMPQIGNQINNNSHNTTNNQFNIQMFLNEHCKNAMNLTDFIESLPITAETYEHTTEYGLTKSITKMMVNGLSELDILQRPIHCTDASRKTLYVKENDTWEKDNELLHVLKGIRELSLKQRINIHKWQDANEGWAVKDDLQTKITMLVSKVMTDIDDDEKETRKIISAISRNTYLTNEIKNEYLS